MRSDTSDLQDRPHASVLFIAPQPFFEGRGSPIRVRSDVQALGELGYRVDLLTLPLGEDLQIPGVTVLRVPNAFGASQLRIGPSLLKAAFDILLLAKAFALVVKNRYQVLHCVEDGGVLGLLLRRIASARLVYEKHSDPASYAGKPMQDLFLRLYSPIEVQVIRRADAVITGPALVSLVREVAPEQRVHSVFSLPSSRARPEPATVGRIRRELLRDGAEILITYVGSFAPYQGIDLLFESIPMVTQRNRAVRFLIIGGSPAEIAERQASVDAAGVGHAVTFLGRIDPDSVPAHLEASDILVSPRILGRNSPIKLLDYLRAGRPIVATDVPANRTYLDESVSLLTQPSAQSLAEGIERLAGDADLRSRLSGVGRRRIESAFTYGEFRQRLADCYTELQI